MINSKNNTIGLRSTICSLLILVGMAMHAQELSTIGYGWAANSINTVVFRKNSVTSIGNRQYAAYYDSSSHVVLAMRTLPNGKWTIRQTAFKGNTADAHNTISIMVDGDGYLHMSWDHHNNKLHYSRSLRPASAEMGAEAPMTGQLEGKVSYPEFYRMPNGNLLFLYRNGQSGEGNLVMNRYDARTRTWSQIQSNLIDGERQRNAYWQACVDVKGRIHLSWVWRETGDVASNHDLCYARSDDGGETWQNARNQIYQLPITAASAEYIARVPQRSELINQTSMYADENGVPFVASYWRDAGDSIPQYHVAWFNNKGWEIRNCGFRKTAFSLSGGGTKRIPISRPQIIAWKDNSTQQVALIFRDEERQRRISAAVTSSVAAGRWTVRDLLNEDVGSWEPTYDTELWKKEKKLAIFVQRTDQADAEGSSNLRPQPVRVLTINLKDLK